MKLEELLSDIDLVCLDFDGLLVDTEAIHHKSYTEAVRLFGYDLDLDFFTYAGYAHHKDGNQLEHVLYQMFPSLKATWQEIKDEKKVLYNVMLKSEHATSVKKYNMMLLEVS